MPKERQDEFLKFPEKIDTETPFYIDPPCHCQPWFTYNETRERMAYRTSSLPYARYTHLGIMA